ncbi:diaminopimelate epimerase [Alicyclobacillus sp. ALC3]|nr:diaminopimelate epimerase [Alicyclobacillus sp. ALC3]
MKVTKMHGLGNNYIYISLFEEQLDEVELAPLAMELSDVRKGIGSDGMILIGPSDKADVRMRIFNADGSEAENCGNGLRCVAKYAVEHGYVGSDSLHIETKASVVEAFAHRNDAGEVDLVTVDMGELDYGPTAVGYRGESVDDIAKLTVGGTDYTGHLVSVGNPHFVCFVDDAVSMPVAEIGPHIERHPDFPNRVNVEFVTPRGRDELDFRVWERGSGITYACGTGACASVAAGVSRGLLSGRVLVHLLGGDLEIEVKDGHVWMTGEAVTVFTGEYNRR